MRSWFLFGVVFAGLMFGACNGVRKQAPVTVIGGFTQGTDYKIVIKGDSVRSIEEQIDSLLAVIDNSMSLFNDSSLLSRINRNETDSIDRFIANCIETAEKISRESGGLYDVTIRPLTAAYGFAGGEPAMAPDLDSLLPLVGYEKISVEGGRLVKADPRMQIDLNSIAQGATTDYIADYFDSVGIGEYLINVGGEIYSRGTNAVGEPWRVGIDRPFEGNMVPGADLIVKIRLSGRGLATSGNYRKFYVNGNGNKVVHTVNPKTGLSFESNLLSATVVADNATLADAYGTAFMVMGLGESVKFLSAHPEIDAFLVYADEKGAYRTHLTDGMKKLVIK